MATTVPLDYQMLIDGELVDSDGGRFDVTNPANGEESADGPNATVDDVRAAIDSAPPRPRRMAQDDRRRARADAARSADVMRGAPTRSAA